MVLSEEDVVTMEDGQIQYPHVIVSYQYFMMNCYLFLFINLAVDCLQPGVPSNGDAAVITTTLGSIVSYSCDSGYALCGNDSRMCLPTGMWSGAVPECVSEYITSNL